MKLSGRVMGKVALVTGAGQGIGKACAKMLAQEGAAVAVTDVLDREGQAVVDEICMEGGTVGYWHLDVSDEEQVRDVMRMVESRFGPITVLVNNAGVSGVNKPTHEVRERDWDRIMNINVKGVFLCTKHAIPQMFKAGKGSIINMSSIYGLVGAPDLPAYHASKGAVRMMTKTDALLYAAKGIRVNSIHPGFIWTPMVEGLLKGHGDAATSRKSLDAMHPLGHIGEAQDVAYGVLYLASNESKFVTGTELVIDGGYTAQ
jgi:NAD(P)-dependent dehydrogenase (short-subunit alcohol dehydrogenase family)